MDRRSENRCPVCQGPAVADPTKRDGMRCRTSICIYNHADKKCPRCQLADLESVRYSGGKFQYTCRECTHTWET